MRWFAGISFLGVAALLLANVAGPGPRNTGGSGDETCARAGCHVGTPVSSGPGTVAINFPGNLAYTPGVVQRLTIAVTDASHPLNFGFQASARLGTNLAGGQAGTWGNVDASTKILCDNGIVRPGPGCPAGSLVEFIEHAQTNTTGTFQVDWTPPSTDVGDVVLYVSGLAGNGDGTAAGDRVYTASYTVKPAQALSIITASTLPAATAFTPYSTAFTISGAVGTPVFSAAGSLPTGMIVSSSQGVLSGTPSVSGTFQFVVTATTPTQVTSKQFTLTVAPLPTYLTFTLPHADSFFTNGINKFGDVAGTLFSNGASRGFIRLQDGTIRYIDIPGSSGTTFTGINENGDVIGTYTDGNGSHAFLRDSAGNLTAVDHPGVPSTTVTSLNKNRQIVGHYSNGGRYTAFIRAADGTFTDITATNNTMALAINDLGQVLGKRFNQNGFNEQGVHFIRQPDGTMTEFAPYSITRDGSSDVQFTGLNNKGVLIGSIPGFIFTPSSAKEVLMRVGEQPVTFTLPDGQLGQATINDAGQFTAINHIASPCTAPLSPTARNHGNGAELGSIDVQATGFCAWYAESSVPWITFTSSVGGTAGKVNYTLAANTGAQRNGTITVAGNTVNITQAAAGCTYTTPSNSLAVGQAGGTGNVTVNTQPGCQWQAATISPWVAFTGSGTGGGGATYTAQPNGSFASRTAILNIGGQTVNLVQSGLICTYTLGTPLTVPGGGSTQSISVTTDSTCAWQATSSVPWLTVAAGSGTGSGLFYITAEPNPTTTQRVGTITVGGQSIQVTQVGNVACQFTFNPNYMSFNSSGGSSSAVLTTTTGCPWTATVPSDSSWITIPGGASGSATGTISYSVAANTTGASRTGAIQVGTSTLTIVQAAPFTSSALRFVPLPPCRLMETRALYNFEGRTGAFGPPALNPSETRTLFLPVSNVCSIPASAKAYQVNVTVIPSTTVDYVTLWPTGDPRPAFWTVRSPDGQTVANTAIVRAGTSGGINVFTSNATDLLIDISGYYTDATSGLAFYPLTPCRVIDTRILYRSPAGPFGPPSMTARETRRFRFPVTPYCQVPQAAAYSVTLTAVPPGPLAYMTAWPGGAGQPNVSSINSFSGRTLANSVIIPASADGSIDVFAFDSTDFLVDINGYFAADNGSGQFYFPITQCRVSDTTVSGAIFADNTARTINIPAAPGCPGIPANAQGYAINVTAIPNGNPMPFLTAYPSGQPQPNASILNAFQGQTVTNSAIIPAGANGAIDVFAFRQTNVVVEVSGYFGR